MRIAVIGSGISGLGAAWLLSRKHEVHLFEAEDRLGGHTHTHFIETSRGLRTIDTGFIVHNDRTYPNLIRLFAELGIDRENSDMSWGVTGAGGQIEYSSRGLGGFFAAKSRIASWEQWQLLGDILRFNRQARELLDSPPGQEQALGDYIEERGYSRIFRDYYLYPTVAAIWSTSPQRVLEFPAVTLIRFFENHGLLTVSGHPQWKVLRGGSSAYVPLLTRPIRERIRTGNAVVAVRRSGNLVRVERAGEEPRDFDHVVVAAHAPQALAMLANPSPAEQSVLSRFAVTRNEAVLHTDESILPRRKAAWASWNYRIPADHAAPATLTYDMNRLQNINTPERYLVTLNSTHLLDPNKILRRMIYQHPLYTLEAVKAQGRWAEISGVDRIHYCGAYWFNGFHEDGYRSALRVAQSLGVECTIY